MEKRIYAVYAGSKWGIYHRLSDARQAAKANGGTIRACSWGLWRECGRSMDAPTFWVNSDQTTWS